MSKSFSELVNERRTIRGFEDKEIPREVLEKVIEKVSLCQTAGNQQNFFAYIVQSKDKIEAVGKATGQAWVETVPCLFVFCCERDESYYGERGVTLYNLQDATIAQTYASLALQEAGLKAGWVGGFSEEGVSAALDIPHHLRPIGILPCGYSDMPPRHERKRKPLEKTFAFV